MWDIRTNDRKYEKKVRKIAKRFKDITINFDEKVGVPVLMIKTEKDGFKEFLRGKREILVFTEYGYNRITRNCPIRNRKCIGNHCAWYYIENFTGDCIKIWNYFKK